LNSTKQSLRVIFPTKSIDHNIISFLINFILFNNRPFYARSLLSNRTENKFIVGKNLLSKSEIEVHLMTQ